VKSGEERKDQLPVISKTMTHNPIHHNVDVYQLVTNRIIELLEKGVIPWQQPWTDGGHPRNLISGRNYRGINVWLLNSLHFQRNIFLTFNQAKDLGATIKKGEKSTPVVFWKWLEKTNPENMETERIPILRYYNVFNISQCEGIPKDKIPELPERKIDPIEACEQIIEGMPQRPEIRHNEQRAYYNRAEDFINLPKPETFKTQEGYYATQFHELIHSTGHTNRLNRRELNESRGMTTNDYAIEELTAEMGASYLKSYAGIPIEQLDNNASYIRYWLERLKKDKKYIVHASAQAQKASDFILNFNIEKELDHSKAQPNNERAEREGELKSIRRLSEKILFNLEK